MSSAAQQRANRENAQKSTGPRTEEGKMRSRMNALKHGQTGQILVMPGDQLAEYEAFAEAYIADLAPQGQVEIQLAASIAHCQWRINRNQAQEAAIFALGDLDHAGKFDTGDDALNSTFAVVLTLQEQAGLLSKLSVYEQRNQRTLQSSLKLLRQIQAERKAARLQELKVAKQVRTYCRLSGLEFNKEEFGFVCSDDEIDRYIHRETVRADADTYHQEHPRTRHAGR